MSDHDLVFLAMITLVSDQLAVLVSHFQAIDHHDRSDGNLDSRSPEPQHFGEMSVLEVKLAGALVVFLVERAAGDEDADRHAAAVLGLGAWG